MTWDLIVIGGGSAGLTAATIAGRVGAKTLLVDKTVLGGDCLHHGCVPSKALIRCARAAHEARSGARFGVNAGDVQVDFAKSMAWVKHTIDHIGAHDSVEAMNAVGVEVAFGGATFEGPNTIRIGADRVEETSRTVICVGSNAKAPPIAGLDAVGYLDNTGIFALTERPARLGVIGGGPIGVEMGQSLARLGSQVTVLQRGERVLGHDDPELTGRLCALLAKELDLKLSASVTSVSPGPGGTKRIHYDQDGESRHIDVDEILLAVGREASTPGLGLEAAGIETERGRIVVDDALRTTASHVFAAGDCVGPFQFTHFAEAQARIAARNALFYGSTAFKAPHVPWVTFSEPELAHVGLTEAQAGELHDDVRVYRYEYDRLDRAICEGETAGLGKLVALKDGTILGASILGPAAGEAIASIVLAMDQGISIQDVGKSIFAYPTLSRVVRRLSDERFLDVGVSRFVTRWFSRFEGR
jgi:pyruvate/2-oxoglutarate dehydrogenase complex dihydrolipoamide dehydrogenase (E3) component